MEFLKIWISANRIILVHGKEYLTFEVKQDASEQGTPFWQWE